MALTYSFPDLEPETNCFFLNCLQISQEAGQVVWYSHLFQNFPQFIVIHTIKGFGIVNKAEIDVFLELSCFFDDPADVGNLIPALWAFPMSQLFTSGGQSTGALASASVLPMNIQGWFPLRLTGLIFLQSKGLLRAFSSTTVGKHQFFTKVLEFQLQHQSFQWIFRIDLL